MKTDNFTSAEAAAEARELLRSARQMNAMLRAIIGITKATPVTKPASASIKPKRLSITVAEAVAIAAELEVSASIAALREIVERVNTRARTHCLDAADLAYDEIDRLA